jgi:transposase
MQWICRAVTRKNPLRLQFTFALWTAKMIGQFIDRRFGVKLGKASVCRLLNQLGLTQHSPVWRAYQQRPEKVQKWLVQEYPRIHRLAKKRKATIFFGDHE